MIRTVRQPFKIVDDFFECPDLWRYHALKQEYTTDEQASWPGVRSTVLDQINETLFHSLASKIIVHCPGKRYFHYLKINYALVDESYNLGWCHVDEPKYNVAGVIFLNPDPPKNSGTIFYKKTKEIMIDFNQLFFNELKAAPEDRKDFYKHKLEQRSHFKKSMTVENVYNRCVIFPPDEWHSADSYFGNDKDSARLTINFFGFAA